MSVPSLLPAYLVVGADQLKRETAISRLKGHLDAGLAAFNLDERTASKEIDPTDIAISLNTLPVGESFRLVIIHEANRLPKPVSETIVSYLANPNPGCVLCLACETLAKNTRLYKAVAKVGKRSVIDCTPLKPRDLPGYVMKHAAAKGLSLDPQAAQELVSRVGDNTVMLDRQLTTLGDVCPSRRIGVADVETYVVRTAEVKPWEFLDKVSAGDAARALELYRHMQSPSHIMLTSLLTRRIRELICARSLIDRGQGTRIASELGRQEWQVRSIVQAARRFSAAHLAWCLKRCAACERDLKGGADSETVFLGLVLDVCHPKA